MFLQRLREYAARLPDLPPPMYQMQPIRYVLMLDEEGTPLGNPQDTADRGSRATERGTRRLAPHVKRAYAIKPKLLADTGVYALGIPTEEARPERVVQQHSAFVELVRTCADATGEPSVQAVARFLGGLDSTALSLPADFDPSATLTFQVGETLPIDLPSVREFWARRAGGEDSPETSDGATVLPCIVCGLRRPVLERHPLKIKGIPGGQTAGTDLISANAGAFESYGLEASLVAPTCQQCAEAYGNALNALLASAETSVRVGQTAFAFWTIEPTDLRLGPLLTEPDPTEVHRLIVSWRFGKEEAIEVDETAFYAVALGASGARVVVRDWIDTSVAEAKRHLGRYFDLQSVVMPYGEPSQPLALWRLANSTVRDARREPPPPIIAESLVALALRGDPPPLDLLFLAVRRNRAEQNVSRERAALTKLVLNAHPETIRGGLVVDTELDGTKRDPAYLCGRLLAVLDAVQRQAINPNATIVDRYYGTASSAPASVFGTLLHGAQAHMGKLRRDRPGAHAALEKRLEDVMIYLKDFPKTLTLAEQGLFALGFYHQRANDRRAMSERIAARGAKDAGTDDTALPDEFEAVAKDDGPAGA